MLNPLWLTFGQSIPSGQFSLIFLYLFLIALILGPGIWVQRVLKKYSEPDDRYAGTGASLARHLLDKHGLQAVSVARFRRKDGLAVDMGID